MNNEVKPGWQTTEFWTTIFSQIIGIAVILRVVPETDAAVLSDQVVSVVQGVFAIVATVGSLWLYVVSRTRVKVAEADLKIAESDIRMAKIEAISSSEQITETDKAEIRAI